METKKIIGNNSGAAILSVPSCNPVSADPKQREKDRAAMLLLLKLQQQLKDRNS